jgi:O-antigen ligase
MSVQGAMRPLPAQATALRLSISTERLRCGVLWLTGAASAIVFIEPSPYEFATLLAIVIFAITGFAIRPAILPFAVLLILTNIGYSISAAPVLPEKGVLTWILTSWYLAASAIFFAAMLGANTEARLAALTRGCLIAGVIASVVAIVGYSRVISSFNELFLLYDRARGTFKDPNVLGAFLVFPTLLALQLVISERLWRAMGAACLLALFAAALLLSFSRAAWGQAVLTGVLFLVLSFVTSRSPGQRVRIVLLTIAGIAALAVFIAGLLSIDAVAELFKERANLRQDHDLGEQGRFGRHLLGAVFALDVPFGIGPLQFSKYFPEDPHNSYLNAFMSGGWLSGACYVTLVMVTLAFGLRQVLIATPWQPVMIAVYVGYVGVAAESVIIDSDHWRHAFMLLGLLWGLIAATTAHQRSHAALVRGRPAA